MDSQRGIYQAIAAGDEEGLTAAIMTELDMHVKAEALVVSVRHGQLACARALLREGCDPCLKHAGRTALYWAVRLDHPAMMHLLLDDLLLLLDDGICLPQPQTSQLHRLHLPQPRGPTQQTHERADTTTQPHGVGESKADEVYADADDVLEKRDLFPDSIADYESSAIDSLSGPSTRDAHAINQAEVVGTEMARSDSMATNNIPSPPRRSKEEKMRARAQRAINEALFEAASHGSNKCIEILLAAHADPNSYFYHDDEFLSWSTPLLAACFAPVYCRQRSEGHEERYLAVVETLVRHGADIGKANCFGDTALHWAAVSAMCPVVLLLLRNGADINRQNSYGRTPLVCCLENDMEGVHAVCRLLLQWGASLDMPDKDGWMALHYAVERRNLASAMLLLESGCRVEHSAPGRMSTLDIAVTTEHAGLVRLLLQWDARVSKSAVQLAVETVDILQNVDIIEMLAVAGGAAHGLLEGVGVWMSACQAGMCSEVADRLRQLVSSPLSLKQCTRLRVREVVRRRAELELLPLPLLLKHYLLFMDL